MSRLLLVDLDNLPGARDGQLWPVQAPHGELGWAGRAADDPPRSASLAGETKGADVVVLAGNLATHRGAALTTAALAKLAGAFAAIVWPHATRPLAVECAVCLTMPQAADAALLRLLAEAPLQNHSGPFDSVALWSRDRGLTVAVQEALGADWIMRTPIAVDRRVWCLGRGARPWQRAWSAPSVALDGYALPVEWSARVEAGNRADALKAFEGPFVDLKAVADAADCAPHVLTQVGITLSSTRGVARLADVAAGTAPLAANLVSEHEGLEVQVAAEPAPDAGACSVTASILGPGAVRLQDAGVTARSRLPWRILDVLAPTDRRDALDSAPDRAVFDDARCLRSLGAGEIAGMDFKIRLRSLIRNAEPRVRADLELRDRMIGPDAWWALLDDGLLKTKSEFEVALPAGAQRWHVDGNPCDAVAWIDASELVFAAPVPELHVNAPRDAEMTTRITVATDPGTDLRCAVLHLAGMSKAYDRAVRIQSIDLPTDAPTWLDATMWKWLQALPLLVRCQISVGAGVQGDVEVARG